MLLHFETPAPRNHFANHTTGEQLDMPAQALAHSAGLWPSPITVHRFPDGEIKLKLPPNLPAEVVIYCSLHQPNEKLVALLLAARTARALGAQHLTLVAPYLAYMRQDMAFAPGEVVSQQVVGRFLAELFDAIITIDPHLHRITRLQEAVPIKQAQALSAAPLLAQYVVRQLARPLLLGPDEESRQWVSQAALPHGLSYGVCHKLRRGDAHVQITLPDLDMRGREVVLMDDVASSGHTLAQAARLALAAGAAHVHVAVTHALMANDAVQVMQEAGISRIWSSNSIVHESNVVNIAPLLTHGLRRLYKPA